MDFIKQDIYLVAAGLGLLLVVGWYVKNNAAEVGAGAVTAVSDMAGGAIQETGAIFGIPKTDATECDKALQEGRTWDAVWACPAGTFLKTVF